MSASDIFGYAGTVEQSDGHATSGRAEQLSGVNYFFRGVLPKEDMLPKRECRLSHQFLCEEIEPVDKCRFPRLLWCYLSGG